MLEADAVLYTALHCALHCALYCTALYCAVLDLTLYSIVQYSTVHCTVEPNQSDGRVGGRDDGRLVRPQSLRG